MLPIMGSTIGGVLGNGQGVTWSITTDAFSTSAIWAAYTTRHGEFIVLCSLCLHGVISIRNFKIAERIVRRSLCNRINVGKEISVAQ